MKKNIFKALVQKLLGQRRGFKKLIDNPAGSKMARWSRQESRRGCDGTMRGY
jgi:hypothetical protein